MLTFCYAKLFQRRPIAIANFVLAAAWKRVLALKSPPGESEWRNKVGEFIIKLWGRVFVDITSYRLQGVSREYKLPHACSSYSTLYITIHLDKPQLELLTRVAAADWDARLFAVMWKIRRRSLSHRRLNHYRTSWMGITILILSLRFLYRWENNIWKFSLICKCMASNAKNLIK